MVEPPSRVLFTPAQIDADLGRFEGKQFESEQSDDGGGEFHFRHWMPVQSAEWRGVVALGARCTISGRTAGCRGVGRALPCLPRAMAREA